MRGICLKEYLFNQTRKGLKDQTRRSIHVPNQYDLQAAEPMQLDIHSMPFLPLQNGEAYFPKPKYQVGNIYFLKEPYASLDREKLLYKYDYEVTDPFRSAQKWKNKLFMPADCARYFIQIKAVKAEYLQNISPRDVIAEGVESGLSTFWNDRQGNQTLCYYANYGFNPRQKKANPAAYEAFGPSGSCFTGNNAHLHAFESLINRINGTDFWEDNPIVWKYVFRLITQGNEKHTTTKFMNRSLK